MNIVKEVARLLGIEVGNISPIFASYARENTI